MNWDKIIGHEDNIGLLRSMLILRKVPHALLFTGVSGIGKMLTARILAAGILCSAKNERPCGSCFSCLACSRSQHPDFREVRPEGEKGLSVKIDQVRALKRFALLSPALLEGRVCVIEDAQTMTAEAANSLLKLLEEPPPNFHFILVASAGQPILPTIVSRCLKVDFLPLPPNILAEKLMEQNKITPEKAQTAANLSGGRIGKAFDLIKPEGLLPRERAFHYLELLSKSGTEMLEEFLDSLTAMERRDVSAFLEYTSALVRDMLFLVINGKNSLEDIIHTEGGLLNPDLAGEICDILSYWDEERLFAANKNLREAVRAVSGNANIRLTIDALTIKLGKL